MGDTHLCMCVIDYWKRQVLLRLLISIISIRLDQRLISLNNETQSFQHLCILVSGGQETGLQLDDRRPHGSHLANEARPTPNNSQPAQSRGDPGLRAPLEGIM